MEELRRRLANAEALVQELLLGREDPAEVPVARSLSPAVGRSIGILVKELTLQSQRQAGLERRQERCCGASSPAHRATGVSLPFHSIFGSFWSVCCRCFDTLENAFLEA